MNGSALQQRLRDALIDRIYEETYPSVTMMNRVEASLRTRAEVEEYGEVLLKKIESTRFPSLSMLNRFDGLIAKLEQ
jgi:hypothetical protein